MEKFLVGYERAFPPIRPMIAPNPIFQVVEHVSNRVLAKSDGFSVNAMKPLITSDRTLSPSTLRNTSLKAGVRVRLAIGGELTGGSVEAT